MSISDLITPRFLSDIHDSFDTFDENRDGYLEPEVVERAFRALGLNPSSEEISDILDDIRHQPVNFNGFLYLVYRHCRYADPLSEIMDSLKLFDKDGTGKIHVDLLSKILYNVRRPFTSDEIDQIIKQSRVRSDNCIGIEDLANSLLSFSE